MDDSPPSAEILRALLEGEGYTVVCADGGANALASAERIRPDLVLLDAMMPGVDGFEVCSQIRRSDALRDTTIILVTALTDRVSRRRGFEAGADDFLSKPVDLAELRVRVRSISDLGRYRRALQVRSRYEDMARLSPVGILAVDANGVVQFGNPAGDALLGVTEGRTLDSFATDESRPALAAWWSAERAQTRAHARLEVHLRGARGNTMPVEIEFGAASSDSAPVVAMLAVQDVSERRAIQARLEQSQRAESVARMTGSISHDFANYLTAIQSGVGLVQCSLPADSAIAPMLDDVVTEIGHAAELVSRLRAFAKGARESNESVVGLTAMVTDTEPLLRHLCGHVALALDLVPAPLPVWADPSRLRQVLVNLVANARDASPDDGHVTVTTFLESRSTEADNASEEAREWYGLRVADEGSGIPPELLTKIFEPFFTTRKGKGGTGLGLATVHNIVSSAGGTIHVESAVGVGTAVSVLWPAFRGPDAIPQITGRPD